MILIAYALYMKFTDIAVPGTAGIIITISFFSGIILLTLGITGIYIARIFEEVRGRDRYVIKNEFNVEFIIVPKVWNLKLDVNKEDERYKLYQL